MVVATTTTFARLEGNGSTISFPFPFKVGEAAHVAVYSFAADTQVLREVGEAEYILQLAENNVGGKVEFTVAPSSNEVIYIRRETDRVQPVVLENQTRYFPNVVMQGLDNLSLQIQELEEKLSRTVKFSFNSEVSPADISSSFTDGHTILWDSASQSFIEGPSLALVEAAASNAAAAAIVAALGYQQQSYFYTVAGQSFYPLAYDPGNQKLLMHVNGVVQVSGVHYTITQVSGNVGVLFYDAPEHSGAIVAYTLTINLPDVDTLGLIVSRPDRQSLVDFITINDAIAGQLYSDGTNWYKGQSGVVTIPDLPGLVPASTSSFLHYAQNTTPGVTDLTAPFTAALQNDVLEIPRGTYGFWGRVDLPGKVKSDGATLTVLDTGGEGLGYPFRPTDGAWLEGVSIRNAAGEYNRTFDLRAGVSGFTIRDVQVDGNLLPFSETGVEPNNYPAFFRLENGDVEDLNIIGMTGENGFWSLLKGNTHTSNDARIRLAFSKFDRMNSTAGLFNSPAAGSSMKHIQVIGNFWGSNLSNQPLGGGAFGFAHRGSFAGQVENAVLMGNVTYGPGQEFWRAEEAARTVSIVGNTGQFEGRDGLELVANNAGGTAYTPSLFAITGNSFEYLGLNTTYEDEVGSGINLEVNTAVGALANSDALGESVISDNVMSGWKNQLHQHQGGNRLLVTDNVMVGGVTAADIGISTRSPSLGNHDNLISDCATAVWFDRGGILGRQHFRSQSALPAAVTIQPGLAAPCIMQGWTWETGRLTVPEGETEYEIIDCGSTIVGQLTISVSLNDVSAYDVVSGEIFYHSARAALTFSPVRQVTNGSLRLRTGNFLGIKNGHLALAIQNTSGVAISGVRVQVGLEGRHQWGV